DNEITTAPPVSTATEGPVFRSVSPNISSKRYFPNQNTVSSGAIFNSWERLPSVSRTMKFGVNVRDNNVNGGQSASQEMVITFEENAGPFNVTSQNLYEEWNSGENKTITWDVANTNDVPVNCTNVNILLSIDGGFTFPITLMSNIPNNGSASIVVPNVTTTQAKVKVESVGNIFYALNDGYISIQAKEFTMDFTNDNSKVCKTTNAVYNFTYNTYLGFNEITTFSASGNPTGTKVSFNPVTATANNTNIEVTISEFNSVTAGNYEINIVGISGTTSLEKTKTLSLELFESTITTPILTTPVDNTLVFVKPYSLAWGGDVNAESYDIQIATDAFFTSVIEESTVNTNVFEPQLLAVNTKYYWRVVSKNTCGGLSNFSSVFNFTTANEICSTYNAIIPIPVPIPDNAPVGVKSIISVTNNKLITNVKVIVNIAHTYVGDLTLELTSPRGVSILLSAGNGGGGSDYTNTIFDDSASTSIADGSAPFIGTFRAQIPLSYLNNTDSQGNWTLKVVDSGEKDTGTIDSWSLDICGIPTASIDNDNDSVTNNIDKCPETAPGNSVDTLGCFKFPENNFEIETIGETCPNSVNGQIVINTQKAYNYTTTINGVLYEFPSGVIVSDLAPGTYDFCIGVYVEDEDKTFEQCFTVLIEAGTVIAGKAVVTDNKVAIEISQGSAPYKVFVNGKVVFETAASLMSIDVNHGDLVTVKTGIECEGLFLTEIDLIAEIIAYPNPTNGFFEISLPTSKKEVKIALYTMQSQLISSKTYPVINGKAQLTIENKPTGVYIAKVYLDKPIALKIIKN
ncbi:MAG: proprotein convertase P-domain-containing protein, partial [Bacteroidetes bacterium]|nr:proprotein convertase P-domain-containing protein [Bacteroidota bacterium]